MNIPIQSTDEHWMRLALAEAEKGLYTTTPNPRVGCVFVRDGQVIATGHHEKAGLAHAEVAAIVQAKAHRVDLTGSTAYVTLEPCAHTGRTGPCAEALIPTGVVRVVVATLDPNPLVAGKGLAILNGAGIVTTVGVLETESRWLNRGFLSRMERRRPWLRLKVASSADGQTALPNGQSQWITGPEARLDGHHLRAQACAILTGLGTVQADDPQLNVRGLDTPRQPIKVVVDSELRISKDAQLLQTGHIILAHANAQTPNWLSHHPNVANIQLLNVPTAEHTKTDLLALMAALAEQGINEVHAEAGYGLNGSLLQSGLVDEIVHYMAPHFLGPGLGMFRLPERRALPQTPAWTLHSTQVLGNDLRIIWTSRS